MSDPAGPTGASATGKGPAADGGAGSGSDQPEGFEDLMDRLAAEQQARDAAEAEADTGGDSRPEPPLVGDEAACLDGFLEFLRATVLMKTEGLTDEQGARPVLGTLTTVTGLLRHLADVERYWFREVVGGVPQAEVGYRWFDTSPNPDRDAEFRLEPGASVEEARDDYRAACSSSLAQRAQRDLDEVVRGAGEPRTVRWVVTHLIEETARHAGHLDVLTELIDGRTGE